MTWIGSARAPWPGAALALALAALASVVARLPGAAALGPLVLALVLAAAWRALVLRGRPLGRFQEGARWAAGPLLKAGIVALGARLDLIALAAAGPWLLVGGVLGAVVAFATAEVVGRGLRVSADLRRLCGIGTAICGASAVVAAAPLLRASATHTSAAIAAISLLGTVGVLGFVGWDAAEAAPAVSATTLGWYAGATLQEVGQVVAAGSVAGAEGEDAALSAKLSRVVLLAPTLLLLGWASAGRERRAAARAGAPAGVRRRAWPVPPFVLGFLAMGALASSGLAGPWFVTSASLVGGVMTAAAMAGIGLGLDLRALRGPGRAALLVGGASFAALLATMAVFEALVR